MLVTCHHLLEQVFMGMGVFLTRKNPRAIYSQNFILALLSRVALFRSSIDCLKLKEIYQGIV